MKITIEGKEYEVSIENHQLVGKEICKETAEVNQFPYVIVRTYSAGVFAGLLESRNGREVVMRKARRLWYWEGAASLSQLAMEGVSKPKECKFPCEVDRVVLLEAIEILDVTPEAKKCIEMVPVWKF
jgi:hypothetical protein